MSLSEELLGVPIHPFEFLDLNAALQRLETIDPRLVRTIELRYFVGFSVDDTAQTLSVSAATVKRDWRLARAWLARALA